MQLIPPEIWTSGDKSQKEVAPPEMIFPQLIFHDTFEFNLILDQLITF